jgi:hypothetical protein
VTEVLVLEPRRHDQEVVFDRLAVVELDDAFADVDALRFGKQHAHVLVRRQQVSKGCCDVRGRQQRGGHLIEQRLKEMMIRSVDDSNANRLASKRPRSGKPAESTTENDDMRAVFR